MAGYATLLPPADELIRQRESTGETLEKIGARYGVSRQAVHKRIKKHQDKQQDK